MSALSRCLLAASHQFLRIAQPAVLSPSAKMIVTAAVMALAATGAFSEKANAQGYVWGNGSSNSSYGNNGNENQSALPAASAGRWGEVLGGVMGRAAGVVMSGGPATSEIGRRMQEVSSGIGEEVGRNMGRTTAQAPYGNSRGNNPGVLNPREISTALLEIPLIERDHLDTLGTNAIFAYAPAAETPPNSPTYQSAQLGRENAVRNFEMSLRAVSDRGFNVSPWAPLRMALQQPLNSMPSARFVQYGQEMTQRLQRQGGPGYQVPQAYLQSQQPQQPMYQQPVYQQRPQVYSNQVYPLQVQQPQQVYQNGQQPQQVYQNGQQPQQIYQNGQQPQAVQPGYQQAPRTNSLEAMRLSMGGMLKPLTSTDRP